MINTRTIRRPMLALIAGSAILLGGAAMPNFCLQNPTMLYVIGEARMALGDHDGGLRMIGSAAERNDKGTSQADKKTETPAAENQNAPTVCKKQDAPRSTKTPEPQTTAVVYHRQDAEPSHAYIQLAKVDNDFGSLPFNKAEFAERMRHLQRAQGIAAQEQARIVVAQVREDLQRRGIAVPSAVVAPPVPPTVQP